MEVGSLEMGMPSLGAVKKGWVMMSLIEMRSKVSTWRMDKIRSLAS